MASPACEVQDGSDPFVGTTNGADVTPGETVTIRLASSAGVGPWTIELASADELTLADITAVRNGIVVDENAKTATFTAPIAGRAYLFKSTINGGTEKDQVTTFGVYTRATIGNRRVMAVGETYEGNALSGYSGTLNDLIRNPTNLTWPSNTGFLHLTGGSPDASATPNLRYAGGKLQTDTSIEWRNTGDSNRKGNLSWTPTSSDKTITLPNASGQIPLLDTTDTLSNKTLTTPTVNGGTFATPILTTPQIVGGSFKYNILGGSLAADRNASLPVLTGHDVFVFADHPQTLTQKTLESPVLNSPTLGGTVTFSATSMQATGNARARSYSDIANVQTTNNTVTTLFSWTILDEAMTFVTAKVGGCRSTGAEIAGYLRGACFKSDGGSVTASAVQSSFTHEDVSTWDCTIDNSTTTGRVRVTGVNSVTIDWGGIIDRLEVSHA